MIRLLRELIPANVLTLLVTESILIATCFVVAGYAVLEVDPFVYMVYDSGLMRVGLVVLTVVLSLYFHDLYANFRVRSRVHLLQQGCLAIGTAFIVQALLSYGSPGLILPKWIMVWGGVLSLVVVVNWRILYSTFALSALTEARLLFVGANDLVRETMSHYEEHPELGFVVLGCVEDGTVPGPSVPDAKRLGGLSDLRRIVGETRPDRIVVGLQERRERLPVQALLDLRLSGLRIDEAARTHEAAFKRVALRDLRPSQLIFAGELGPAPGLQIIQHVYSMLIALAGTVLLAPVMLLIAVALKLTSKGPVLYRQRRTGYHGAVFTLYKFRSMYADAEAETGAVWATPSDPRVTPLGRWLRMLRLDELPQFFNVLRGEMLIVGPRPERPEFVETLTEHVPYYRQRLCVKPGITGWAQINHKYGDTMEDVIRKLEFDLYYIKNLSPALDAYIIFHTLKTMLLSRGAQ